METRGITSFKRRAVSNASGQLVLLIEQEKKEMEEKSRENRREEKVRGVEVGLEQGVTQTVTKCHSWPQEQRMFVYDFLLLSNMVSFSS